MSARPTLPTLKTCAQQVRTVVHHARPPRVPYLASPSNPRPIKPTSGTSTLNPKGQQAIQSKVVLADTGFVYDYNPPASAPSYTSGIAPDFLKWVGVAGPEAQRSVRLTGEHVAGLRKARTGRTERLQISPETVQEIVAARAEGLSRSEVAKKFSLDPATHSLIARLAPASKEQRNVETEALARQQAKWGFRKSLAREKRQERKKYW